MIAEFRDRVEAPTLHVGEVSATVRNVALTGVRRSFGRGYPACCGTALKGDETSMVADLPESSTVFPSPGPSHREEVTTALLVNPGWLRNDPSLLAQLGLRLDAANIVDFGPVALSRVSAAHQRESSARKRLETMAQANFAAQTQTHAAVIDVMDSVGLDDLATRVDQLTRRRFGLTVGSLALEGGETPGGWFSLIKGQADLILGVGQAARLGHVPTAAGLFGAHGPAIQSVALARLSIWSPTRQAVMAFGSADPEAFTQDMGAELVIFLARVVERTAQRWPRP